MPFQLSRVAGCQMANAGLEKVVAAGAVLSQIEEQVAEIDNMNALISQAAQEQSSVAEEINKNVVVISQLTEQTSGGTAETSQASDELVKLSARLESLAASFKVS